MLQARACQRGGVQGKGRPRVSTVRLGLENARDPTDLSTPDASVFCVLFYLGCARRSLGEIRVRVRDQLEWVTYEAGARGVSGLCRMLSPGQATTAFSLPRSDPRLCTLLALCILLLVSLGHIRKGSRILLVWCSGVAPGRAQEPWRAPNCPVPSNSGMSHLPSQAGFRDQGDPQAVGSSETPQIRPAGPRRLY